MRYDTLDRPLLFLDVDGPLVTFRLRPEGLDHSPGRSVIEPSAAAADPLLNRFNPDDGRRLLGVGMPSGLGDDMDGGGQRGDLSTDRPSPAARRGLARHG
jgi:hypothetical protein